MSTKMSTDLNVTRPTSRVLRAPGGGSSFSICKLNIYIVNLFLMKIKTQLTKIVTLEKITKTWKSTKTQGKQRV